MSSGGGSSPTPNRTFTGAITSNVKLWLVSEQYKMESGHWQMAPMTNITANANNKTIFIANGETVNGSVSYVTDDGTQFVLVFTMNGTNTANIMATQGTPQIYTYDKSLPTTSDTITVTYTLNRKGEPS